MGTVVLCDGSPLFLHSNLLVFFRLIYFHAFSLKFLNEPLQFIVFLFTCRHSSSSNVRWVTEEWADCPWVLNPPGSVHMQTKKWPQQYPLLEDAMPVSKDSSFGQFHLSRQAWANRTCQVFLTRLKLPLTLSWFGLCFLFNFWAIKLLLLL